MLADEAVHWTGVIPSRLVLPTVSQRMRASSMLFDDARSPWWDRPTRR